MQVRVVDHPLVAHKLTLLRERDADSPSFRRLTEELVTLLAYEATRELHVRTVDVDTPVAPAVGLRLSGPTPLLVPILRAGLGMLEPMQRLMPNAEVGFLGMVRDEKTLLATAYAERLPADLTGRPAFVLDPMLATGGTLAMSLEFLIARGVGRITAVTLLAAPEGLRRLEEALAGVDAPVDVVTAAVDERLDDSGFIVPGLGDAGDRLFGVVD